MNPKVLKKIDSKLFYPDDPRLIGEIEQLFDTVTDLLKSKTLTPEQVKETVTPLINSLNDGWNNAIFHTIDLIKIKLKEEYGVPLDCFILV